MGIGTGNFVFLSRSYHGGKDRMGRPGSREKEIGFERERAPLLSCFGTTARITLGIWAKVIIPGGSFFFFFIAEMEVKPTEGRPKRA